MKRYSPSSTIKARLEHLLTLCVGRPRSLLQIVLLIFGLGCLVWVGDAYLEAFIFQMHGDRVLQEEVALRQDSATGQTGGVQGSPREDCVVPLNPTLPLLGSVVGRLEVPRLGISVIVAEGTNADVLRKAVGHVPGTAELCAAGNSAIAGHRDTFFRSLKDIREGDVIKVTSPQATKEYRVEWTEVVKPTDLDVLAQTPKSSVTLMTCYPFHYVGAAPDRFVVRATEIQERRRG